MLNWTVPVKGDSVIFLKPIIDMHRRNLYVVIKLLSLPCCRYKTSDGMMMSLAFCFVCLCCFKSGSHSAEIRLFFFFSIICSVLQQRNSRSPISLTSCKKNPPVSNGFPLTTNHSAKSASMILRHHVIWILKTPRFADTNAGPVPKQSFLVPDCNLFIVHCISIIYTYFDSYLLCISTSIWELQWFLDVCSLNCDRSYLKIPSISTAARLTIEMEFYFPRATWY